MPTLDLIAGPLWQRWALVLVHLLWQASLIAMLATAALHILRRKPAGQRYAVCLAAMLVIAACPLVTFFFVQPLPTGAMANRVATNNARNSATGNAGDFLSTPTNPGSPFLADRADASRKAMDASNAGAPSEPPAARRSPDAFGVSANRAEPFAADADSAATGDSRQSMVALYVAAQPWIILAWQLGVLLLSVRLLVDYFQSRSLRLTGRVAPREMRERVATLSRKLGLSRLPTLKCSKQIDQPVVLGLLKPMILLPASWITQLPPDMLTTLLVHELAHIRRHDLWINLLQRVIEIVFFFHPAVWWLSSRTRIERELCCDETVIAVTRDRLAYATTLEFAARQRLALVGPALGAQIGGSSMSLLHRVRNVLGIDAPAAPRRNWLSGALALTVPVVIAGASLVMTPAVPIGTGSALAEDRPREKPVVREGERREGDRRDEEKPREGDRPRPPAGEGDRRPEGERPLPPREGDRRPEGERARLEAPRGEVAELTSLVREMRRELEQLRREVAELRAARGEGRPAVREGEGRPALREGERREGDRPLPPREGERREGDRPRPPVGEGDRPRPPAGEGDRPRPDGERRPPIREGQGERPRGEGDRPREGERARPPAPPREGER